MDALSKDLLQYILSFLSVRELLSFGLTSKRYLAASSSDALWKPFYEHFDVRHFYDKIPKGMHMLNGHALERLEANANFKAAVRERVMTHVLIRTTDQWRDDDTWSADETSVKLVIVGDGANGKTSFLMRVGMSVFPTEYVPTVFTFNDVAATYRGKSLKLGLFDTAGGEEFERLSRLYYPATDVMLLTYCCTSRRSFDNLKSRWFPEVRRLLPKVPIIIVATKCDLKGNAEAMIELEEKWHPLVSSEEGQKLAEEFGCVAHIETSSLNGQGCGTVIATAIQTAYERRNNDDDKGKKCVIC